MLPRAMSSSSSSSSSRRRSPNFPQLCALLTFVLLLLSLSLLHSRLSLLPLLFLPSSSPSSPLLDPFDDASNDAFDGPPDDDRIDLLDLDEDPPKPPSDDADSDDSEDPPDPLSSSLVWDHSLAVHRLSFSSKPDPDPNPGSNSDPDPATTDLAFSSDDQPIAVADQIRSKLHSVDAIEDVLMLKSAPGSENNPLRNGWAAWLEGKGDFLRRDRMLKSNLELLNPKNHPLLQDPDVAGVSGYSRGDLLVQKSILREMEKVPFPGAVQEVTARRKNLQLEEGEESSRRWGYFPGINEGGQLSFEGFLERFFDMGRCRIRVFMVWNSPSWMFGVRHQRGLESLLKLHPDACVVLLSEMMEMDFFESFFKDG